MGKQAKRAMSFVQLVRERFQANGKHALDSLPELDEESVLQANAEYLIATLGLNADGLKVIYHILYDPCRHKGNVS